MANRNDPFFSRLTKLFRSGPAIQRRVKGYDYKSYYDNQLVRGNLGYRGPFPFGRESSPFSVLGAYGILDRMARYCLSGDVLVATNTQQGFISMKDLAAEFEKPVTERKKHYTFSYEPNSNSIVLREILDAFKTKKDRLVEVHYDNGAVLRCTADHRIMLRDGTYREARYLQPGDAVMPFYRKTLKKYKNNNDYRVVYSPAEGWKGEHKIVGEYIRGTKILPEEMLHVHHKNFIGIDNEIDNLMILPAAEHLAYHSKLGTRHSIEKSKHWAQILNTKESCAMAKMKNGKYRKRKAEKAIRYPKCIQNGFLNPNADSEFTIEDIKKNWESGITLADLCTKCGVHQGKLLSRLQWAGYEGYSDFVRKCFNSKYLVNCPKPRFPSELPDIQSIYSFYRKGMTQTQIAKHFGFKTGYSILSALRKNGYNTWYDFTTTYQNNKVVRVVETDQIEDVYDLTVEGTHNFAVIDPKTMQPCGIVHNSEFAEMEYQPEIAAALNIFADETAAGDEKGKAFHLYSKNPEVKKALEELFYDILNIDFNLRPWTRNLVKYGDFFLYNEVIPDIGIVNVQPIPVNELEREEGFDQHDPYAVRYKWLTRGNRYLENWQVSHMRVLGNDLFLPYGTSILEPARRIWRQLIMMEDSMLVYRVVRSPERRVFYIDVGNVAPNDVPSYMEAVKQTMRSRDVVDRTNGRMDQRYNPLPVHKDTPIPLLDGRTVTIEELSKEYASGKENWVYSIQDKTQQIVPGKVIWCGKNYTAKKLVKVWLDDDTYITTAPEHPFVLRDGTSKRADQLTVGQTLMPFYHKFSTKKDGMLVEGYPMVYDPSTETYKFSHRIVANSILNEERENIRKNTNWKENNNLTVHHKDCNRLNSYPDNLQWIGNVDHISLHAKLGTERLVKYNKSIEKRLKTIEDNKKYNKGKKLAQAYNGTELHKQHNELRRKAQKESWEKDSSNRKTAMRWNIPELFWIELAKAVKENPTFGREKIHNLLMQNELIVHALKENQNTERSIEKFSFAAWEGELLRKGFAKLAGYRSHVLDKQNVGYKNHKIKNIEVLEVPGEDVYCMTVVGPKGEDDRHNFAAQTVYNDNKVSYNGVFVLNSIDEDYFIPVRGGQTGTKIETLAGGQNATAVDDVKYLQQKLFAAIQVPKPYLNFDENLSAKASLAQQDVRFSRTVSVLQRVIISELNKMAMVHLYSKGFDGEDLIAFELKLSNPSTVAMQQKLEALSTKFEIAGKAKETKLVDQDWIQKKILDLTDDDIIRIEAGIRRDKIREVEIEAIAVKENLPEKDTTTGPFDPSNYVMSGGAVKKNPPLDEPIGGNANTPIQPKNITADMQAIATSGVSVAGQPSASPDAAPSGMPIKATPFLSAARHNKRRRVGMGGRSNLAIPDFKDMLSGTNKYLSDINDKETLNLKSQFTTISEDINLELDYKAPPVISRDMKNLMTKLDIYFEKNGGRKNKKLLTENDVNLNNLYEEQIFEMQSIGDEIVVNSYDQPEKQNVLKEQEEDKNDDLDLSILE